MSANSPSEQYAKSASCSAAPGMPSEEEILRAINVGWRDGDEFDNPAALSAILSLIRPAFELKDVEIEQLEEMVRREQDAAIHWCGEAAKFNEQRSAAEAKLAQAAGALEAAHVAMNLATTLPGVSSEYDFSDAIAGTEAVLRARSASAVARGET